MKSLLRLILKTLVILLFLLAVYQFVQPLNELGKISLYNSVFPGRERLPFGETPRTAYNFSLNNLNAMFASHKIAAAGEKQADSLRVIVIGDSSSWGTLLRPQQTLAGQLDGQSIPGLQKRIECFNLAYPTLSLSKDLLLLERAMVYEPDFIIWPMTLESFPLDKQTGTALVNNNAAEFNLLAEKVGLQSHIASEDNWQRRSFWGQRRELADLVRLQLYGMMWAATDIDQDYPQDYIAPKRDLEADNSFHGVEGVYPESALSWDVLQAAKKVAAGVPVLIINEPMLISDGENSDIRYNFYYPREAYDAWRVALTEKTKTDEINLLDLWDVLPVERFTNSAIHYDAEGAAEVAKLTLAKISKILTEDKNE